MKDAFNRKFFNRQKNQYANNSVTANLLPLYFNMVPDSAREAVFNSVYNKIKIDNHMHISTGVIGTQVLMRTLTAHQRSDIAYTLASNRTYPSWGYMAANGATTIWELWNGNTANPQMNSQNHVMLLGDLLTWFYEHMAGIRSDAEQVAFKKIIMKPENIDGLNHVSASYQSPYGLIRSAWKKLEANGGYSWQVSIPANSTAIMYIPADAPEEIRENGQALAANPDVRFLRMEGKYAVFILGNDIFLQ